MKTTYAERVVLTQPPLKPEKDQVEKLLARMAHLEEEVIRLKKVVTEKRYI